MNITVTKAKKLKELPADENNLGFGRIFTDHMFIMDYKTGDGWHNPRVVPFGNLSLSPAAMVFHYAQEIFEGLKAYRTKDGSVQLFRPTENLKRMNVSAERLVIPEIPEDTALEGLKTLVKLDERWTPSADGSSLYIRPFIIATDPYVGVRPADNYMFIIIMSPSGAYYSSGFNPVSIRVEDKYVRSVKGGAGFAKTGGNYAASLIGQEEAHKQGYEQVLWLDGVNKKYIEEVGSMNIFFVIDGVVTTPSLEGSILSGITRKSVIDICRAKGLKVEERLISIDEVMAAQKQGRLDEVFGTGTAAVISPVGKLKYSDTSFEINGGKTGKLAQELFDTLTGIQYGRIGDTFGWTEKV